MERGTHSLVGIPPPSPVFGGERSGVRGRLTRKRSSMRELLAELNHTLEGNRPCVFCSVVETRGSTPQKAGAAMLVYPDGSQRGTLGGGCVEAGVKQQALRLPGG